ncbi:MAG: hypothetical protein ACKOH8_08845 [Gemmatimonadota bacterium]
MAFEGGRLSLARIEFQLDPEQIDRGRDDAADDWYRRVKHGENGPSRLR